MELCELYEKYEEINLRLESLVVFSNLRYDDVIAEMAGLVYHTLPMFLEDKNEYNFINKYRDFAEELYKNNINFSEYVLQKTLEDENFYIIGKAQGIEFDVYIEECVKNELETLQMLSLITPEQFQEDLKDVLECKIFLPKWRTSEIDFLSEYKKRINNINIYGYGKYSKNKMFILKDGETIPVKYPDSQRLDHLYGYERERQAVINNTLALLNGKPAQNTLLYGDAGTGKSSTVKAIVNEYASKGLRLIEVTKEQLRDIPHIIDSISKNPLKFILFIDDLSFSSDDDCFGALKATLEGSVSARADNIAIYATSNRRHLVKERFSDRDGDDVHRNDTIQELISLSARFGLKVNFSKPDKNAYIDIVTSLAEINNINLDKDSLSVQAESFAIKNGGRSARTAKQFINQLIADGKN